MSGYFPVLVWTKWKPEPQAYLARTVFEARQAYAKELGCPVTEVMGRRSPDTLSKVAFG